MGKNARLMELVYNRSSAQPQSAESIPTLVNAKTLEVLQEGDSAPYYKVEAIDFPTEGSGGTYTKEFFKSFVNVIKNRPIPGSKRGHEWTSRPSTDFYTVGGSIVENGDGKTGTVYLKIYIPPKGDTTDNAGFIRDAKAGIVHFSLVTIPERIVKRDEKGNEKNFFIGSAGLERNDAVEYGAGAMEQEVNSAGDKVLSASVANARSLIKSGKFDALSKWSFDSKDEDKLLGANGDDWDSYKKWHMVENSGAAKETKARYKYPYGKNGKVYRSALRAIASRAAQADLPDLSDTATELLQYMDEQRKNGGRFMDKDEVLAVVKNLMANGQVSLIDIARNSNVEKLVRTEQDEKNAALCASMVERLGDKPIEKIDAILAENKANAESILENKIAIVAGPRLENNAEGKPVENAAHRYAKTLCNGKTGADLDATLAALKDDPVMVALNARRADHESDLNRSAASKKPSGEQNKGAGSVPVLEV